MVDQGDHIFQLHDSCWDGIHVSGNRETKVHRGDYHFYNPSFSLMTFFYGCLIRKIDACVCMRLYATVMVSRCTL